MAKPRKPRDPERDKNLKKPAQGTRSPDSVWGEPAPIVPKAKKPTSITPQKPEMPTGGRKKKSHKEKSVEKLPSFRTPDAGFELTEQGQLAYESLMAAAPKVDLAKLAEVEERFPGDRQKIVQVLESLALGARHREALADVGWVWSNFSIYRSRFPIINGIYQEVARLGEETRKIIRLDEAHRRATEGVEEAVYSASGKYCGTKIKYSDALLTLFLKADHPDKFTDRHEVKSTGVVLNMQMGLRENVRETAMTQGDIKVESPFADEKKEDLPGGV